MLVKTQRIEHELVMPKNYTDLSKDEMEYDGGFLNFIASAICAVASTVMVYVGEQTGNKALVATGVAVGVVSAICSFGLSTAALGVANLSTKAAATYIAKELVVSPIVTSVSTATGINSYNSI